MANKPPVDPYTTQPPGGDTQTGAAGATTPPPDQSTVDLIKAITGILGTTTTAKTPEELAYEALRGQFYSAYTALWGTIPPPGYIRAALSSGQNLIEFQDAEMQKPSFARTRAYRDSAATAAGSLAQAMGTLG